ncbi:hypothetical protein PCANC_25781 [Puccinia coronata f. sp. avenae]|uniref:Uncharacterized protein n=1 Tax=Puccinia coronata f. sp. avenae TaxID=200324 RepID=A0A2N5S911_9BASI|nr:hypothetical protein PCANC_26709 [Puccinia coronata f. sp. avenae]PLW32627.1 hypothetical protein PCANC_25781 [Puccinia coronata f. sp. avenae]
MCSAPPACLLRPAPSPHALSPARSLAQPGTLPSPSPLPPCPGTLSKLPTSSSSKDQPLQASTNWPNQTNS